jgi:hypothetical protein
MAARAVAGFLTVCSLALAACGDGREEAASVEQTIVTLSQSDDPADCRRLSTIGFLEQSAKLEGRAAVEFCEETTVDPAAEDPKKVIVADVDVDGSTATATARFVGSSYDGQSVRFGLVERDGIWKIDELLGFIELDAERLVVELGREGLRRSASPRDAQFVICVMGLLERMDDEELETLLDYGPDEYWGHIESCVSSSQSL